MRGVVCPSETLNVIFMELPKISKLSDNISKLTKAQMWGKFFLYASKPEKAEYIQKLTQTKGVSIELIANSLKMSLDEIREITKDVKPVKA